MHDAAILAESGFLLFFFFFFFKRLCSTFQKRPDRLLAFQDLFWVCVLKCKGGTLRMERGELRQNNMET